MTVRLGSRRRRIGVAALFVVALSAAGSVMPAHGAHAYWSVASAAGSAGSGSAATVMPGPQPSVTVAGRDITVSWPAGALSNGVPASAYSITRTDSTGVAQSILAGCAGNLTVRNCTEVGVPDGLWSYRVTSRLNAWSGSAGPATTVRVDQTAPVNSLSIDASTRAGGAALNASTLYYRGVSAGSVRLVNSVSDSGSGPQSSTTGQLTGDSTGWSHTASNVASPASGPYVSNPLSWVAGTSSSPNLGVTGFDNFGNSAPVTVRLVNDSTAPTAGSISYPNGSWASTTIPITLGASSDTGSGIPAGSRLLQMSRATLVDDVCGTFSSFSTVSVDPVAGGSTSHQLVQSADNCYRFQYVVSDAVGNTATSTSAITLKLKAYWSTVRNTPGLVNQFRLFDTGITAVDAGPAKSNGTYSGSPAWGQESPFVGDRDRSTYFDGVDDQMRFARAIQDDFSIELWMRTSTGRGTGNWYSGAGLVDADVAYSNDDFGLSVMANGQIAAGTGNPDTTVKSTDGRNYADNAWHHVVMTRQKATGAIRLYVDGSLVGSGTGSTNSLSASPTITVGNIQSSQNWYTGYLDELATYNVALTDAQVRSHYFAGSP